MELGMDKTGSIRIFRMFSLNFYFTKENWVCVRVKAKYAKYAKIKCDETESSKKIDMKHRALHQEV